MITPIAEESVAACRSMAYRFLAILFLNHPDPGWLATVAREGLLEEFPVPVGNERMAEGLALLSAFCGELAASAAPDAGKRLGAEYDRLFVGPGHVPAPPWESVYRSDEHILFDWPTLEVRAEYRRMGLEMVRIEEADDHIGLELLFLASLCEREAAGDAQAHRVQVAFVQQHLLQWAPAFCADVLANAGCDLYRGLALLTGGMLEQER